MQVYSCLAYGVTGIGYFTYDQAFMRGLLEEDFSPNRLYHDAARLNAEVANLGQALRFLASTDVRYVRGQHEEDGQLVDNPAPTGIGTFHPNSRVATQVREITIHEQGLDKNAMIGFFQDDQSNDYFMLVNLTHGKDVTAEQGALSVTLTLAPSVATLARLHRDTGRPEQLTVTDGKVELTLPGGTGELFRINGLDFPDVQKTVKAD